MKYRINKGTVSETIDGKTVIFDSDKSVFFIFNETAGYIFKLMKKGTDESKLPGLLAKKYAISERRAIKDIYKLIADLKRKKIISAA